MHRLLSKTVCHLCKQTSFKFATLKPNPKPSPDPNPYPPQTAQDSLPEKQVKTFADVKGCPDAKAELEEVVAFLKHPDRFTRHAPPASCTLSSMSYTFVSVLCWDSVRSSR